MLDEITSWLSAVNSFVWGIPLIVLILVTGIYLTIRLGFLQIRYLPKALKFMFKNEKDGLGEVSSFSALCTALSATIGTGNIVGVATAIATGGAGALFWMWIAALFGMATKYAEGVLSIKYRTIDKNGHVLGGPFYYIERGMGKKWKWLAKSFAFFGVTAGLLGIGTITQISGITDAARGVFDANNSNTVNIFGMDFSWSIIITGLIVTICTALVIVGGIKRISSVSQIVVPFMAVIYILFGLVILIYNYDKIPSAFGIIFDNAFSMQSVGGGMLGTAMMVAMQKGIARGIFSNEAGLGSAPIAAAAAKTKEPVRQGLVSMTGTFVDTIIICTVTGLSIVIGMMIAPEATAGLDGVILTTAAFQHALPFFSNEVTSIILMVCLSFFAFTTILGWDYYSERCVEYLVGGNKLVLKGYRWLYILAVFIGPYLTITAVWTIADIFNGLMALPNLVALLGLSGIVIKETKDFFEREKSSLKKHH